MRNPLFNKQHLTEYFIYGLLGAIVYMIPVLYFLYEHKYENFYYIYLGNILFMFAIMIYVSRLLSREYDGKRAATMMVAGTLATTAGVILSGILLLISMIFMFPDLMNETNPNRVIAEAPETIQTNMPGQLLAMLIVNTIIANFGVGGFISVVIAYAGKRDQRKDKPESLDAHLPNRNTKV